MHSIVRRTLTIVFLAELAAAVTLCFAVLRHEQMTRLHALDVSLQGRADSLLGAVQDAEDPGDHVTVDPAELRLPTEDFWAVFNADGSLIGRSANDDVLSSRLQPQDGISDQVLAGNSYRMLQHHALRIIDRDETAGQGLRRPVILLYALPETHLAREAFEGARFYLLAVLVVGLLTAGFVAAFLQVSLRPLSELAAAAERVALPDLLFTPPESVERITELRPLARTLLSVLEKLRHAFVREQQFFGDAAHELKTAVAVVRSTIQLTMLKDRAPEEYRAGLTRALEDTHRLETLVSQMLSLARIEDTSSSVQATCDLSDSLEEAILELHSVSAHAGVQVIPSSISGAVVSLTADRARTLITNLLSNAIQHSLPEAQVHVSIRAQEHTIVLSVRDTGDGIAPDALPHLFERFYRADPSRARATGGTGLGLAICKSIVDQAGGTIHIASEPRRGTTVTVTFRAA